MSQAQADREAQRREHNEQKELESLRRVFEQLDKTKLGKVGFKELNEQLIKLDYRAKRVEVEAFFTGVAFGATHAAAWTRDGRVFCWGADTAHGQLGSSGAEPAAPRSGLRSASTMLAVRSSSASGRPSAWQRSATL